MRGIVKGEVSNTANPLLQLFCRSSQLLADMHSGTYLIEDITGGSPVTRASGSFVALTHKLGTGRYLIPTGATSAWTVGTHRLKCSYKLTDTGPTHTQVEFFELLDDSEFATSLGFITYLTSKQALADGLVAGTTAALQRHMMEAARLIEEWTGNWFEPRYLTHKLEGDKKKALYMDVPIIAIELVETVSKDSSGNETRYPWNAAYWRAYNRHLDGYSEEDDRYNPKIELIMADPAECASNTSYLDWTWPYGQQNAEITGVFGFTDPAPDIAAPNMSLGIQPYELRRIMTAVMLRISEDYALQSPTTQQGGRVKKYKSRHQSVEFFGASGSGNQYGSMSGDPLIDQLLVRLCRATNARYVQRKYE